MYRIVTYEMKPNTTAKFIKLKYNFIGSIYQTLIQGHLQTMISP
jgi:hypothetical protein